MNILKKYWNDAYLYVLLLIPGNCICAGVTYTAGKIVGWYPDTPWFWVLFFDFSQLVYLCISFCFIIHKKKVTYFSQKDISRIKLFVTISLFIQYNLIMHLFPTHNAWSCSFIFMGIVAFLFDVKLMITHILGYTFFLIVAHLIHWDKLVPSAPNERTDLMVYRTVVYALTALAFLVITYLVEKFLMREREQEEENVYLMEKQLEYYQSCDLMDKELRKFRHDIKGHFLGLEYLLENKNYEELGNYFKELNNSFSFQERLYFSGNLIIDSILNYDLPNKCDPHVKILVSGRLTDLETVSSIDLCTLFSNILSNAISAVNQCPSEEQAQLSVRFDSGSKFFSITIVNSIPEGYSITQTTKAARITHNLDRNHGHGIRKIMELCKKYNGEFNQTIHENKVTTTAYLPL